MRTMTLLAFVFLISAILPATPTQAAAAEVCIFGGHTAYVADPYYDQDFKVWTTYTDLDCTNTALSKTVQTTKIDWIKSKYCNPGPTKCSFMSDYKRIEIEKPAALEARLIAELYDLGYVMVNDKTLVKK